VKEQRVQRVLVVSSLLLVAGLAACSGSTSSGGGNPLSGVVITQATPSPVPTATPVPTPTPATDVNVIADPSFATEGAAGAYNPTTGWTPCTIVQPAVGSSTPVPAVSPSSAIGAILASSTTYLYPPSNPPSFLGNDQISTPPGNSDSTPAPVTPQVDSGDTYSALTYVGGQEGELFSNGSSFTGETGANGICQTFSVPTGATMTVAVNEGGTESGVQYGQQEAYLIPQPSGTPIPVFVELNDTNHDVYNTVPGAGAVTTISPATQGGTWVQHGPYNLTGSPYNLTPGQSVELFIGVDDNGPEFEAPGATKAGFGVFMFVDNVSVVGVPATPATIHRAPAAVVRPRH
jgi:hypothetical protein